MARPALIREHPGRTRSLRAGGAVGRALHVCLPSPGSPAEAQPSGRPPCLPPCLPRATRSERSQDHPGVVAALALGDDGDREVLRHAGRHLSIGRRHPVGLVLGVLDQDTPPARRLAGRRRPRDADVGGDDDLAPPRIDGVAGRDLRSVPSGPSHTARPLTTPAPRVARLCRWRIWRWYSCSWRRSSAVSRRPAKKLGRDGVCRSDAGMTIRRWVMLVLRAMAAW